MGEQRHLSPRDAEFLALEPQTIFATAIVFRMIEGRGAPTIPQLRAKVRDCLPQVPELGRRAVPVPGHLAPPRWVDVNELDEDYHIRRFGPDREVSVDELAVISARLMSLKLDLSKPLWRFLVIERVAGGRFCVVAQMHHAMGDGLAALGMFVVALTDLGAVLPTAASPPDGDSGPVPDGSALVREALAYRLRAGVRGAGALSRAVTPTQWPRLGSTATSLYRLSRRPAFRPSDPPPWAIRGPDRARVDFWQASLSDMRRVRNTLAPSGTVNDVVLAAVANGVRQYYEARGWIPRDVHALIPFSFRSESGDPGAGNVFSELGVRLPVTVSDPVERLRCIHSQTHELKDAHAAEATALVSKVLGQRWVPPPVRTGLAQRLFTYDLLVSNLRGPQVPLYGFGGEVEAVFPAQGPVSGLSLTLISVRDRVCFALSVGRESMVDVNAFIEGVKTGFEAFREAAAHVRAVQGVAHFAPLPEPTQLALGSGLDQLNAPAGTTVIAQGSTGDAFYIVRSGTLEIIKDGEPCRRLAPGDSFGEVALVEDIPRTATVRAVSDAQLWRIDRDSFLTVLSDHAPARRVAQVIVDGRLGGLGE